MILVLVCAGEMGRNSSTYVPKTDRETRQHRPRPRKKMSPEPDLKLSEDNCRFMPYLNYVLLNLNLEVHECVHTE